MGGILTIGKCLPYVAGPAVFAHEEALAFSDLGRRVDFLTYATYPSGALSDPEEISPDTPGVLFHRVEIPNEPKLVAPGTEVALLSRGIEILKSRRMDVDFINAHYAIPHGLVAVVLSKFFGVPAVVTVHGSDVWKLPLDSAFRESARLVFEKAGILVAVSESLRGEVLDFLGPDAQRDIHVLGIAVRIGRFADAQAQPDLLARGGPKILSVGRFDYQQKRLDVLLEAFRKIVEYFQTARLILVGEGRNAELARLEQDIKRLDLEKHVILIRGVFKRLPSIYRAADLFVLTSQFEGFPNSLCEAAASGLPIVTTPVGSVPDYFLEGNNCLYAKIGDVDDLTEKMVRLLLDRQLRRTMGKANFQLAKERFDLRRRCTYLVSLVEQIRTQNKEK